MRICPRPLPASVAPTRTRFHSTSATRPPKLISAQHRRGQQCNDGWRAWPAHSPSRPPSLPRWPRPRWWSSSPSSSCSAPQTPRFPRPHFLLFVGEQRIPPLLQSDGREERCGRDMGNKQTVFSEEQLEDYTVRDWQRKEGSREALISIRLATVQRL